MQLWNRSRRQFLISIATFYGKQSDLVMYFTVNTAFIHYFDNLTDALDVHMSQDWTPHEQVLPISLQMFDFNSKLLEPPKPLKDFVYPIQAKEGNIG